MRVIVRQLDGQDALAWMESVSAIESAAADRQMARL
jgi:hypothetical protein